MDRVGYTAAKQITRLLPLLLLLTVPAAVQAQDFNYTTNNGSITITKYLGSGGAVVIPDMIDNLPVTSIGASAFASCYSLTSVTFGTNVAIIGADAFNTCIHLSSVTIPDGVTIIGDRAFKNTELTCVTLGNDVTYIGDQAFQYCYQLTSITIPDSTTSIGQEVLFGCGSLTNIIVDAANTSYSSPEGVLFDKALNTLIQYPSSKEAEDYTIPDGVKSIGYYAFDCCFSLTSVTIPDSVTSIGIMAFCQCSGLTNVVIGNSVTIIESQAFQGCDKLTRVTIPDSVTSIGDVAFYGCTSLASITIPDSVTGIGHLTFARCSSLTNAVIGNSVTGIGEGTFEYCNSLTSVTIGSSVAFIGNGMDAFFGCSSLSSITVDAANPCYSSYGGVLFNKNRTTLIEYPKGKTGNYTIPDGVTRLDYPAFADCKELTGIVIPNSVTSIRDWSFAYCSGLKTVTIGSGVTNIEGTIFYSCANLANVNFKGNAPDSVSDVFGSYSDAMVYYLLGTKRWGTMFGGRPTVLWNPQTVNDASFGIREAGFGFTITNAGSPTVLVEASTNLSNPVWIPVGTNTLTGGSSDYNDSQWTNYPNRFYRFRMP